MSAREEYGFPVISAATTKRALETKSHGLAALSIYMPWWTEMMVWKDVVSMLL